MKRCGRCHCDKDESQFNRNARGKNGLRSVCRQCDTATSKRWASQNRGKRLEASKRWQAKHPKETVESRRKSKAKNRDRINAYERQRCATDIEFRLKRRLRCRIGYAIRSQGASKSDRTEKLIGCSAEFLRGYLEARFWPGMSWKNYGTVWEIDHRIPCASYDLTDPSHQRSCFHYSNLQPLFCGENKSKNARQPGPHQAELL